MSQDVVVPECEAVARAVGADGLGEYVESFIAGLRQRIVALTVDGSSRDLADAAQQIERVVRTGEGLSAVVTEAVDRRGLHLDDGHRDAKGWLRANVQLAPVDAARRQRLGRFGRAVPLAAELLASGTLGLGQANQLALTWSNPRVRRDLEATADIWLTCSRLVPFDVFAARLDEWARLSDHDGGFRERDTIHNGRDVRMMNVGSTSYVRGRFGTLQGEALQQVFDAFCDAEYRFDRDEAMSRLRRAVSAADLTRTPAQRRADAFAKMVLAAANAPLGSKRIDITVDIVVDQDTFEQQLVDLFDPLHHHDAGAAEPSGAAGTVRAMCHTVRGAPVHPAEAVIASLIGHVRRVVWGAGSVVIDLGRRGRLYTGSARDAVFLQAAIDARDRCVWPGCRHRPRQVDHGVAHADGGATRPDNGPGCCAHHNLFKSRGYQTRRDEHGHWHTYRPDGTELIAQ